MPCLLANVSTPGSHAQRHLAALEAATVALVEQQVRAERQSLLALGFGGKAGNELESWGPSWHLAPMNAVSFLANACEACVWA